MAGEPLDDCTCHHLRGFGPRVAENAGRDGREGQRPGMDRGGGLQGSDRGVPEHAFVVLAGPVTGADHMDDMRRLQGPGRRNGGLGPSYWTVLPHPLVRLLLYHPAARSNDCGGYSASMRKRLVGGIDNCVDRLAGDITLNDEHVGFPNLAMRDDVHSSRLRVAWRRAFAVVLFRVEQVGVCWRESTKSDTDTPDNPTTEPGDGRLVAEDWQA